MTVASFLATTQGDQTKLPLMESCCSKANQLPTKGANMGKIATNWDTIIEWLKGTNYEKR